MSRDSIEMRKFNEITIEEYPRIFASLRFNGDSYTSLTFEVSKSALVLIRQKYYSNPKIRELADIEIQKELDNQKSLVLQAQTTLLHKITRTIAGKSHSLESLTKCLGTLAEITGLKANQQSQGNSIVFQVPPELVQFRQQKHE